MNELEQLKAELEQVKKQAAAMREALQWIWDEAECGYIIGDGPKECGLCGSKEGTHTDECYQGRIERALQPDAGRDFISRESVKPLVEALRTTTSQVCSSNPWHQKVAAEKTGQEALEHARKLGL